MATTEVRGRPKPPSASISPTTASRVLTAMSGRAGRRVLPGLFLVLVLVAWELSIDAFSVPRYILPAPSAVVGRLTAEFPLVYGHFLITATEALLGFLLAVVVSSILALAIAHSRLIENVLYPYLVLIKSTPIVAIAPLLTLWFGFGLAPKVVIAFLIAFFPMVVNMVLGLQSPDRDMIRLMRSLAAPERLIYWKVRIPYSVPYVLSAFKIAAPLTVVGAIVGEMVGADTGLGYLIMMARGRIDAELMFVAILMSAALGVALFFIFVAIERWAVRWHESSL